MLDLYNLLTKKLFLDPYGKCLITKDVRTFLIEKDFDKLDMVDNTDIKYFLVKFKDVYLIPLKLPSEDIFGILFKSINSKNFLNYKFNENSTLTFGLEDFNDFVFNNKILLVEGIKECMTFKLFYPYTLAYLTSSPSIKLFEYLKQISNQIVFIPDNDRIGKRLKFIDKYNIYNKYFSYKNKDFGTYWESGDRNILDEVKNILKMEGIIQ
ncbi:MAG: hypothetical protein ABSG25_01590 [Bryobacteraceae bacterium]